MTLVFYIFPLYVKEVLHYEHFEVIRSVESYTVIFLMVPLAVLLRKMKPVYAILLGFLLSSMAWVVVGMQHSILFTIAGLIIYAAGEAIQSPRYYEYITTLAPLGQIGTFMGFALFLPAFIDTFVVRYVDYLGSWLLTTYKYGGEANPMMWFWPAGIGFVTMALMFLLSVFTPRSPVKA